MVSNSPVCPVDDSSLEEENTVSSASLCMSPVDSATIDAVVVPLCASTPLASSVRTPNEYPAVDGRRTTDVFDNARTSEVLIENFNANTVSESTSMDVLSGGESDAGDTLNRRNNNDSISTHLSKSLRESAGDAQRRRGSEISFFIARELLMTERTFKRDLELITVAWSACVSKLSSEGAEGASGDVVAALARPCLALEPLALAQGGLLARLERTLAVSPPSPSPSPNQHYEEPEYRKIAELMSDYLTNTYEAYAGYTERSGALVGVVESVRRRSGAAARACAAFEAHAPLPLSCLLLRPLHRLLHYAKLATEIAECGDPGVDGERRARTAQEVSARLACVAARQLRHVENHATLCQLQRDIVGYDKLLVVDREFIRLGCVYKHSTRGLQQKMLFLFNDVAVLASKAGSAQFRANTAFPLRALHVARAQPPHTFTLCTLATPAAPASTEHQPPSEEGINLMLSASNEIEFEAWYQALELAIENAREETTDIDTELTPYEQESGGERAASNGGALTHVCWHRVASLARDNLHTAMRSQASGYLLRKFKNSHGWQKLWVVFAAFTLFFYKSWHDEAPLACLPLLGYTVGAPSDSDAIYKDYVFKLQFKNHVYFFRADSQYTYNRWYEVLKTAMVHFK